MPGVEPTNSLLQYIIAASAAVGTAIGTAIAVVKLRARRNGRNGTFYRSDIVTKSDLLDARRQMEEAAKADRHAIYGKIQEFSARQELDMHRIEDNFAEYVKSNELRMREIEHNSNERLTKIEIDAARRRR